MNQIEFARDIDNVLAIAEERCISVICGWTLHIPKEKAVEYVNNYNKSSIVGFIEEYDSGNVILSHEGGRITFSKQESVAFIDLIKAAYF